MNFKLMLSSKADVSKLRYPLLVSPKLDGVRAAVQNGVLVSRSQHPIPNKWCQLLFGNKRFEGLDGELIVGSPVARDAAGNSLVFNNTTGPLRAVEGKPQVTFYVFDRYPGGLAEIQDTVLPQFNGDTVGSAYRQRYLQLQKDIPKLRKGLARWPSYENKNLLVPCLQLVEQIAVEDREQLEQFEEECVSAGYEGVMGRSPYAPYKQGRSTAKEGYLLKLKRFDDAEAIVIGVEEQMHNANLHTLTRNGKAVRSTHKAGMQATGMLGALVVRGLNGPFKGVEFNVGIGFSDEQRRELWQCAVIENTKTVKPRYILGRTIRYKYQPVGSMQKPRVPVFTGFRDKE